MGLLVLTGLCAQGALADRTLPPHADSTEEPRQALEDALRTLQEARSHIQAVQAERAVEISKKQSQYQEMEQELTRLRASSLGSPEPSPPLYDQINQLWRRIVDESIASLHVLREDTPLPDLPLKPNQILRQMEGSAPARDYEEAYRLAKAEKDRAHVSAERLREERERRNQQLLLGTSRLRAEMLNRILWPRERSPFHLSDAYVADLWREIRILPYRWVALVSLEWANTRGQLRSGLSGMLALAERLVTICLILTIPLGCFYAARRFWSALDLLRQKRLKEGRLGPAELSFLEILRRISPYGPWISLLVALELIQVLFDAKRFPSVDFLIGLMMLLAGYRLLRLFIAIQVRRLADSINGTTDSIWDRVPISKVERTASAVTLVLFLLIVLIKTTEATVGHVLAYELVQGLGIMLALLGFAIIARKWSLEIAQGASLWLPAPLGPKLARWTQGRCAVLLCAPTALLLLVRHLITSALNWLEQRDSYKRLAANLLQKHLSSGQLGAVGAYDTRLPADYIAAMLHPTPLPLVSHGDLAAYQRIAQDIASWASVPGGRDAPRIRGVMGPSGSGKTTMLARLESQVQNLTIVHGAFPRRGSSAEDVTNYLRSLAQKSTVTGAQEPQKLLFLIDQCENLLGSREKPLAAWQAFLRHCIQSPRHHYYFFAMASETLDYLTWAENDTHLGISTECLSPWSESEIKQLILSRQRLTSYPLVYDPLIPMASAMTDYRQSSQSEAQFFRLLWNESDGSPGVALEIWLQSVTVSDVGQLRVSIPRRWLPPNITTWTPHHRFAYGALVRYGPMTVDDLATTTHLAEATVSLILEQGVDSGLLRRDAERRLSVCLSAQGWLLEHLRSQNIIHG